MDRSRLSLKYGDRKTTVTINKKNLIQVIKPNEIEARDEEGEIIRAMQHPIETPMLHEIVSTLKTSKKDLSAVIIVNDVTRSTPTKKLLPHVLKDLHKGGISADSVTILFGLGIHRSLAEGEMRTLVGDDVFEHCHCINHDTDECAFVGTTSHGTRVSANTRVLHADVRICLGAIELHYFAGYSGGYKSLLPGICARETIEANHKLMLQPNAAAGRLDSPVRKDLEEAGRLIRCDFLVNVVLNSKKQIVKAVAGDPVAAHREGVKVVDSMYIIPITELADVVVVSAGGTPKDINLFQAQKALDNARYAVKRGGAIVLAAECPEGLGEKVFERWIYEAHDKQELIDRLDSAFEIGGHKAGTLAKLTENADVYLVSELREEIVQRAFLLCARDLDDALQATAHKYGRDARITVMPFGALTLPRLQLKTSR